jgi:hypothetical protein
MLHRVDEANIGEVLEKILSPSLGLTMKTEITSAPKRRNQFSHPHGANT